MIMGPKFNYDDIVRVKANARAELRPGERAWIVSVFEQRPKGSYFDRFPEGVVYSIEFEDGSSTEVHEDELELEAAALHPKAP
jgi:hypothetical protein